MNRFAFVGVLELNALLDDDLTFKICALERRFFSTRYIKPYTVGHYLESRPGRTGLLVI
jgi:hypothetical protein